MPGVDIEKLIVEALEETREEFDVPELRRRIYRKRKPQLFGKYILCSGPNGKLFHGKDYSRKFAEALCKLLQSGEIHCRLRADFEYFFDDYLPTTLEWLCETQGLWMTLDDVLNLPIPRPLLLSSPGVVSDATPLPGVFLKEHPDAEYRRIDMRARREARRALRRQYAPTRRAWR